MEPTQRSDVRTITDARVLAAMTHPLRRRLLDALTVDGPSTVSMLAERTGQAAGNVSHHCKTLAQAELIEEAPELARDRREHWWRVSATSRRWSTASFEGDPAAEAVANAALSLDLDYHVNKVRSYQAQRESYPAEYVDAAFSTNTWLQLSPAELAQLSEEIRALTTKWRDRPIPDDGVARHSVFVFAHGVPANP
jgi:DNA-binding transcriptional ArsR family regulator